MSVFEFDIMFVYKNISANYDLYIIYSVTYINHNGGRLSRPQNLQKKGG